MTWSKQDIINLSFNVLNKSSVNTLEDSGEFSDSANRAFDMLLPAELSVQSWRFATKVQQLSVLVDAPPLQRWTYQLQLPADYLSAIQIFPRVGYQIYEDKMYCNHNAVILEYRFVPHPTALPSYFVHYFVLKLASWFANAVANDDNLARSIEAKCNFELQKALFTDSQSHPIPAMGNNPITQVRGGWGDWGSWRTGGSY
jgi:hypothetical protein